MSGSKLISAPMVGTASVAPSERSERIRLSLVIELVLLAASLTVTVYAFRILVDGMNHNGPGGDEGFFSWGGWSILKGLTPYREFLDYKPPMIFITHALAQKIYGVEGLAYRNFFLWFPLGSVLALQLSLVSRRIDKWLAMGLALALVHIWVNHTYHDTALSDSESIGLAYYMYGIAFLLARTRFRRTTRGIGAAFLTLCVFSKEPYGPCVVFSWATCFFMEEGANLSKRRILEYARDTFIGIGVVIAALVAYMAPTGALTAYIAMAQRYVKIFADPVTGGCVAANRYRHTTALDDLIRAWDKGRAEFLNLPTLGYLLPLVGAYAVYTFRKSRWLFGFSILAGIAGLYAVHAPKCQWMHYYTMALSGIFLCLSVGLDGLAPHYRGSDSARHHFVRFVFVAAPLAVLLPRLEAEWPHFGKRPKPQAVLDLVPGSMQAIREHTKEDDHIYTSGNPFLYVATNRLSATRYSAFFDSLLPSYEGETDTERVRPTFEELVRNRPKIVILDPQHGRDRVRLQKALYDPFLAQFPYKEISPHIYLRED